MRILILDDVTNAFIAEIAAELVVMQASRVRVVVHQPIAVDHTTHGEPADPARRIDLKNGLIFWHDTLEFANELA